MIERTRCTECRDVVERCCPDCVRERCECGARIDWLDVEPLGARESTLDAFTKGGTA